MNFNKMKDETLFVTEAVQVHALSSPVRSQIMGILMQGEGRSVAELARAVEASGPATHYQVMKLVKAGLVRPTGKRKIGPRSESVYEAVAKRIKISPTGDSPDYTAALVALALSSLRKLEREIGTAYSGPPSAGGVPPVQIIERSGYLDPAEVEKLSELSKAAADLLKPHTERPQGIRLGLHIYTVTAPGSP